MKSLRIAIMAHNLRVAGGLSVGQNVIAALGRVAPQHEYLLILPAGVGYENVPRPPRCTTHFFERGGGPLGVLRFESRELPRMVREFRPDLLWGLGNFGLAAPGCKQAFLFHKPQFIYDRKHTKVESWKPWLMNWLARRRLLQSLPATQLVFCQTQTAAGRFRKFLGWQGPIAIMPNAVSRFATSEPAPRPAVFERLQGKLVLFCLTKFYAHKNLESFLSLFREHGARLRDVVVLLTVSADQHPKAPAFLAAAQSPELRDHIVNVGPLKQHELAGYYRNAGALILPTLLESFTGTYLEAMQFDCPILTSDLDFAREVCEDAAIYFDPWSAASMYEAIVRLRDEAGLAQRLKEAGRKRAETTFRSWDEIVRDALTELERVVASGA